MAGRANKGPRNPEEWLERLTKVIPDVEEQRELKKKFCPIRESSIDQLKNVKDRLSAMNKAKNCADIGGSGITFVSSLLAVTGQILSLTGLVKPGACKAMVESGQLGSLLGRSVSYGGKGANKIAQWWNAKTVTSILEEDAKISMALMESLIRLEELQTIVEEVMSFDVFTRIVNFCKRKRNVNAEDVDADLPPEICDSIQSSSLSKSLKAKTEEWMTAIYRSLPSRKTFFSAMGKCKNIDLSGGRQTYDDLCLIKTHVFEMAPTGSVLKTNYDYHTREGIINAIVLGLDVHSLCNQYQLMCGKCRDVNAESEFVKKLDQCINLLQKELDIIKSLNLD